MHKEEKEMSFPLPKYRQQYLWLQPLFTMKLSFKPSLHVTPIEYLGGNRVKEWKENKKYKREEG